MCLHLSCGHHPLLISKAISHASGTTVISQRFWENSHLDLVQIIPVNYWKKKLCTVWSVSGDGTDGFNNLQLSLINYIQRCSSYRSVNILVPYNKRGNVCVERNMETRLRQQCCRKNKREVLKFWVCVCSLSYPACKAHASCYIVACGLSDCTIFFHIIS